MEIDEVTGTVLDEAIKLHRRIGPGLLEVVYEQLLGAALLRRGLAVQRQLAIDVFDEGEVFPAAFRIDLLVERSVIVEIKSVERLAPVHGKQVLTYLRLTGLQAGLLINFNCAVLKDGVQRIVNGYVPSASPRLRVNQIFFHAEARRSEGGFTGHLVNPAWMSAVSMALRAASLGGVIGRRSSSGIQSSSFAIAYLVGPGEASENNAA